MSIERRGFDIDEIELRETEDGEQILEGYGIVFGKESRDLGGFKEVIKREAVNGVLDNDIAGLLNHDKNMVLGRTKSGTMRLSVDSKGVKYRINLPNTTAGNDAKESVKRGDIDGSSFGFRVKKDGEKWERRQDGTVIRTITAFDKILDIGPVTFPAYTDTDADVAKREYRAFKEEREKESTDKENEQPDYGLRKLNLRRKKLNNKAKI